MFRESSGVYGDYCVGAILWLYRGYKDYCIGVILGLDRGYKFLDSPKGIMKIG